MTEEQQKLIQEEKSIALAAEVVEPEKAQAYPELFDQETGLGDYTNKKLLSTISQNCCPQNTPKAVFAMFIGQCQATGLNPLNKEIWLLKIHGNYHVMIGINGFYSIASRHPMYDGMLFVTEFDDNGKPALSTATAYRKDWKHPSIGIARWTEDAKSEVGKSGAKTQWGERPTHMLEKIAKARALRPLFPQRLNGVYLPEEVGIYEPGKKSDLATALDGALMQTVDTVDVDTV